MKYWSDNFFFMSQLFFSSYFQRFARKIKRKYIFYKNCTLTTPIGELVRVTQKNTKAILKSVKFPTSFIKLICNIVKAGIMDGHHMHMDSPNHDHTNHMDHANMDHVMHSGHMMNISHINADLNSILNNTSIKNGLDYNSDVRADAHQHHGDQMLHHGHHNQGSHMDMSMTFHGGYLETILFSWWKVTDVGEFVGSFFAIFVMALLYEGLKYYRKHLLWKTYTGLQYCAVSPPDKGVSNICATDEPQVIQPIPHMLERNIPTMLSTAHAWQTVLHGVQVLVSYMLMLVFMTYNTWLCAAVVLGSATGYFLFGWRESVVVDFTEHCH